ncbi:MAG: DUF2189 domain-containing protein [Sphingomonadales bacterium]|nr:DUF2189 domain-containing protein [Sphingomonadales bacterium]
MDSVDQVRIGSSSVARDLTLADLRAALAAGGGDFRAHPWFGLFFAGIYVVAGLVLYFTLFQRGQIAWLVPAAAGFPLLAPFIAVGLYEVSRRREAGLPSSWGAILGALRGRGDDQLLMMGGFVFLGFTFWIGVAHGIFAIFLSEAGTGIGSIDFLFSGAGMTMLLVGGVAGALMALLFYAITVMSLPMMVDREVDFLTAIFMSVTAVRANPVVLIAWAVFMAVSLFAAMLPYFLGLLVVLPVLAHATWHLYRRTVRADA